MRKLAPQSGLEPELFEQSSSLIDPSRRKAIQEVELTEIGKTVTEYFCEHANARYISPVPSEATFAKYYEPDREERIDPSNLVSRALSTEDDISCRERSKKVLHRLTDLLNHTSIGLDGEKILEVGCGLGHLGNLLINKFNANYFGVDASRVSREISTKNGVQILGRGMGDISEQVFDAVVCFHVLEHVPTPDRFVSKIYDLIKAEGFLFLEVPDGFWAGRTYFKHPWSFSRRSLILLLNQAGFRVLRIDCRDTLGYPNRTDTITLVAQKESSPIEDQDGVPSALTYKQYRVIRYGTFYERARRKIERFLPEPVKFPLRIILRKLRVI